MPQYGLEVFDVERATRYGGNIRAYVARQGVHPVTQAVTDLLKEEEDKKLFNPETWEKWRERIIENRIKFQQFLYSAKGDGKSTVIATCPGRGAVLAHYYGLDIHLTPYVAEIPTGLKIGLYMPGKHIPVVSNEILWEEQPDYIIILAWHYADYIIKDFKDRGITSKFIMPLPEFKIIE